MGRPDPEVVCPVGDGVTLRKDGEWPVVEEVVDDEPERTTMFGDHFMVTNWNDEGRHRGSATVMSSNAIRALYDAGQLDAVFARWLHALRGDDEVNTDDGPMPPVGDRYRAQMDMWVCPACSAICVDKNPDDYEANAVVLLTCENCSEVYTARMASWWRPGCGEEG